MFQSPVKATIGKRIAAFIIDHVIFCVFSGMLFYIFSFITNVNLKTISFESLVNIVNRIIITILVIYIFKDCIGGRSIGKRIIGIAVREKADLNKVPNFAKLILRNLFILIWPVEFFVLILDKENCRLGDKLSKTLVVMNLHRIIR